MTPTQTITLFCSTADTAYKTYPTQTFTILQKYSISVDPAVFLIEASFNEDDSLVITSLTNATNELICLIAYGQNDSLAAPSSTPLPELPVKFPCPCPVIATQAEAVAGTNNSKFMTPLRTMQLINDPGIWNIVTTTGTHQTIAGQNYISTYSGTTTFKLPLLATVGQKITFVTTAGKLYINQNGGQNILAGSLGFVGTFVNNDGISSQLNNTTITLVCIVENTTWAVLSTSLIASQTLQLEN